MSSHSVEDFIVIDCACGYEVKEISGELKLEYHESLFVRTAQRRSQ